MERVYRAQQGLVFHDLECARGAGSHRLAYCGVTRPLLVNDKLPIDNLEHGGEHLDAVCCVDADFGS